MNKGRPLKLTDELKIIISTHRHWTAKEIYDDLSSRLRLKIKKEKPNYTDKQIEDEIQELCPGESSIQKYLRSLKKPESNTKEKWSLATLCNDSNMPAEAIASIIRVQSWLYRTKDLKDERLTSRQVRWIAKLHAIPKLINEELLWKATYGYSLYETICEQAEVKIDTAELDRALMNGDFEAQLSDFLLNKVEREDLIEGFLKTKKEGGKL